MPLFLNFAVDLKSNKKFDMLLLCVIVFGDAVYFALIAYLMVFVLCKNIGWLCYNLNFTCSLVRKMPKPLLGEEGIMIIYFS